MLKWKAVFLIAESKMAAFMNGHPPPQSVTHAICHP